MLHTAQRQAMRRGDDRKGLNKTNRGMIGKLRNSIRFRNVSMFLLDCAMVLLSIYLSLELRFEMYIPLRHILTMLHAIPFILVCYMSAYTIGGVYRIMWRYAGVRDMARLAGLSILACGLTLALNQFLVLGLVLSEVLL